MMSCFDSKEFKAAKFSGCIMGGNIRNILSLTTEKEITSMFETGK